MTYRLRQKIALAGAATMALLGTGITAAQATSHYVSANVYVQEKSNWCWAATSRTVLQHVTGSAPSQCQIVKWAKDSSSCANSTGSFGGDVADALYSGGVSDVGTVITTSMSYQAVKDEVNVNRLVMVRWGWTSGGGHMLVLRGYNTSGSMVSYVNPLNSSFQSASYSYLVSSSDHRWTHSRYYIL